MVRVCADSIPAHRNRDIKVLRNIGGKLRHYSLSEDMKNNLPENMKVSEFYTPRWSADGKVLFFGLTSKAQIKSAGPKVAVDIWHWRDGEVQSRQKDRYYEKSNESIPMCLVAGRKTLETSY